jgi:hypothetical protein
MIPCPDCGHKNKESAVECAGCGRDLGWANQERPVSTLVSGSVVKGFFFWAGWLVASLIGSLAGNVVGMIVFCLVLEVAGFSETAAAIAWGTAQGFCIGLVQWIYFLLFVYRTWLWFPASVLGATVFSAVLLLIDVGRVYQCAYVGLGGSLDHCRRCAHKTQTVH